LEKFLKRIKTIAILLIAILISVIAFCGLYVKEYGIWKNILPDFELGMELDGFRELRYVLNESEEEKEIYVDENGKYKGDVIASTEEKEGEAEKVEVEGEYKKEKRTIKVNPQENINIENFEKTKNIIQKRLEKISLYEYNIRQNSITGEIVVELPDNENIELEEGLISTVGNLSVIDHQTGVILIEDENIETATMLTSTENNQYQSYLQITFDEVGTEKIKEISKNYTTVTAGDGTETTSYIEVKLDNQTLITTYFGEELTQGAIQIPVGQATSDYQEYMKTAMNVQQIIGIINSESLPLTYELKSDNFVNSPITNNVKNVIKISFAIVLVVISIYMIIKYKFEGVKHAILSIGYIALLFLTIRYTDVALTINSIVAALGIITINYVFNLKLLGKLNKETNKKVAYKETIKEIYLAIVPVIIIALIFTFMSSLVISSIGMTLFWGILLQLLVSLVVLV